MKNTTFVVSILGFLPFFIHFLTFIYTFFIFFLYFFYIFCMEKALQIGKWLLVLVVALVATFFIVAQFLPEETNISRNIIINKPVGIPFAQIGVFAEWYDWAVWDLNDPKMTRTDDGNGMKIGHHREWNSASQGGNGAQTITGIEPNQKITMDFMMEGQGTSVETFDFVAKDSTTTELTWTMHTEHKSAMERIFGYFFFEKLLGPDFEQSLKNLKEKCEKM